MIESTLSIIIMFTVVTVLAGLMTLYLNKEYWTKHTIPTYDSTVYWFFFSMTCIAFAILVGCFTLSITTEF